MAATDGETRLPDLDPKKELDRTWVLRKVLDQKQVA